MIGDKLLITDYHRAAAAKILEAVHHRLGTHSGPLAVSIAGESGCGKSETAHCLAEALEAEGRACLILSQDDYFHLPPKSNHRKRLTDLSWVGPQEVRLDLLETHVAAIKQRPTEPIEKPLVHFAEDRIDSETVAPDRPPGSPTQDGPSPGPPGPRRAWDIVIVEGTYTTRLAHVDVRAFIDLTYRQTKKARLARARDPDVGFLERVLEIEHQEISRHKAAADVVVDPPPSERGLDP